MHVPPPRLSVPLNALRAFEAAARHLSIKEAAAEIGVTPSAVSHQVRALEDLLGVALLRRAGPRLELTETGRALSPQLSTGFARIAEAVTAVTAQRRVGPLRVSILPTFATHWLSPRLASYPFARPGCGLVISTTQDVVDLAAGVADVGVRQGAGAWADLRADLLFEETVALFAHPRARAVDEPALRRAVGGANFFLPQRLQAAFERWNATLPGGPVVPGRVTVVDTAGLGLKAAMDGAGITLAGREIAERDLAARRLVALFDHAVPAGLGYYLVYPPALERDRRVRNLRDWMLQQAEAVGLPPSASAA